MGLIKWRKGTMKPLIIVLTAVGLGLTVLGLTLTIIGTRPGYAPYGGNPLKIVGPIMLVLGVLTIMGVIVEWCVRSQREQKDPEKPVDLSKPRETFKGSQMQQQQVQIRPKKKEPPLMTSTGNPPTPVFRPEDALPQAQEKLAQQDSKNRVPPQNGPNQAGNYRNGYNPGTGEQQVNWGPPQGQNYNRDGPKSAHFQPIHQAAPHPSVQYAQVQHTMPQHQYQKPQPIRTEYTQIQHPQQQPKMTNQRQVSTTSGDYFVPSQVGYQPPSQSDDRNGNGQSGTGRLRWGASKESLDRSTNQEELPILDISKAGKEKQDNGNAAGPGDKYHRSGSYREANKGAKPTKSPRVQRRQKGRDADETDVKKRYSSENPGYVREMPVDVHKESTPKDRSGYSSHNNSRDYRNSPKDNRDDNNFKRRNSSRTRRGSKRKQHSSRRNDADRDRDRERSRSRERPRERSNSRGRFGMDDSTTLDFVRGVPIDKDSRRKAPRPSMDTDDERYQGKHPKDRVGDARRNYDSDDSRSHYKKEETRESSTPSDSSRRHKNRQGIDNNGYHPDERALTPMTRAEDILNSKEAREAKNMNFTININAQPGSAVQIALGNKGLPTPRPMITATPLKTEVNTHLEEEP